jgi:multiple sugar transport system substrate-binding protein
MRPMRKRIVLGVLAALSAGTGLMLSACGSSSSSGATSAAAFKPNAPIRGQHITVLLPYAVPQSILNQFTQQTGVKLTYQTAGWDNVKSKLIVANTASTYIADVTEFDWSFTGQFGGSGWYVPLETALGPQLINDLGKVNQAFQTNGHTYAACYSNDYRLSLYNEKAFAAAGIKAFPSTFAQLTTVLDTLKSKHVAPYPMSLPLGATEGGLTPWYLTTLAMGGALFDAHNKPVFGQPGSTALKALQFEIQALKTGWISPGSVTLDDTPAADNFRAGEAAILYASGPGQLSTANDPTQSKIAGSVRAGLVPGVNGPGNSFALPEGLGIPVTAQHKDAALAFIKWWLEPKTQMEMYTTGSVGLLPCRLSAIRALVRAGNLQSGAVLEAQLSHIVSLFPQGAPVWYSKFDTRAQQLINAAAKGEMSPSQALQQLSAYTSTLAGG